MNRNMICLVLGFLFLLNVPVDLPSRDAEKQAALKLSDYRTVQWISYKGYTPREIMALDNNGALLMACRAGKTREQLVEEMGISVLDSQLRLLKIFRLLTIEDGVFKTAFPILDPGTISRIRGQSKKMARDLEKIIRADTLELLALLKSRGRKKNAYSILFAYVLDGMIWSDFSAAGLVRSTKVTVETPFWAGELYSYYPSRAFSCGTNTFIRGNYAIKQNWNTPTIELIRSFYKEFSKLDPETVQQILDTGMMKNPEHKKTFSVYGICDEAGRVLIPVIHEDDRNKLYQTSRRISKNLASQVAETSSLKQFTEEFGLRDVKQALVILYHEVMWDLMEELEKTTSLKKPVPLANPENATPKNVADLTFAVRHESEE